MKFRLLAAAAMVLAAGAAQAYDDRWAVSGLPGEYPRGVSVSGEDVTVFGREFPNPDRTPSVLCRLAPGATYHPWNLERVDADGLEFFAASEIEPMIVVEPGLYEFADGEPPLELALGDRIDYLHYGAEGFFMVRVGGKPRMADQSLLDRVVFVNGEGDGEVHEWMRVLCLADPDDQWGRRDYAWIMLDQFDGLEGVEEANITGYPHAADLDLSAPRE